MSVSPPRCTSWSPLRCVACPALRMSAARAHCAADCAKRISLDVSPPNRGSRLVGNRLSKIYTRTGDDGTTGLGDGTRVAKDSARVNAYGTVDEANSAIGVLLASPLPAPQGDAIAALLTTIQHQLFDLGEIGRAS